MKKKFLSLTFALLILYACSPAAEEQQKTVKNEVALAGDTKKFFNHISSLCGKKFEGKETYTAEGRESYAGKTMMIHFESCSENEIRIPFHIGDDKSRTWLLLVENGRLRFRHDHRHEDGTPEDITMYGGYADDQGTEFSQFFPPDDYTLDLLERAPGHFWGLCLSEDMKTLTYCLQTIDNIVFQAKFYIDKPVE